MDTTIISRSDQQARVRLPPPPVGPETSTGLELTVPDEIVADITGNGLGNLERVRIRIAVHKTQAVCTGLQLVAANGKAVTRVDLRRLAIQDLVDAVVVKAHTLHVPVHTVGDENDADAFDDLEGDSVPFGPGVLTIDGRKIDEAVKRALRPKRREQTPEFLAEVAEIYKADTTGAPTQAVAETLNGSHRSAARWIRAARDAGLLPETTPGKVTK